MGCGKKGHPYWTRFMIIINSIMLVVGMAGVGLGVYEFIKEGNWLVPSFLLYGLPILGFVVMIISILGIDGSRKAGAKQDNDECNVQLWVYSIITFIILLAFMGIVYAGIAFGISDVDTQETGTSSNEIEKEIIVQLHANPSQWVDLQNYNECCGYDNTESTADLRTGTACAKDTNNTLSMGISLQPKVGTSLTSMQLKVFSDLVCKNLIDNVLGNEVKKSTSSCGVVQHPGSPFYSLTAHLNTPSFKPVPISVSILKKLKGIVESDNDINNIVETGTLKFLSLLSTTEVNGKLGPPVTADYQPQGYVNMSGVWEGGPCNEALMCSTLNATAFMAMDVSIALDRVDADATCTTAAIGQSQAGGCSIAATMFLAGKANVPDASVLKSVWQGRVQLKQGMEYLTLSSLTGVLDLGDGQRPLNLNLMHHKRDRVLLEVGELAPMCKEKLVEGLSFHIIETSIICGVLIIILLLTYIGSIVLLCCKPKTAAKEYMSNRELPELRNSSLGAYQL